MTPVQTLAALAAQESPGGFRIVGGLVALVVLVVVAYWSLATVAEGNWRAALGKFSLCLVCGVGFVIDLYFVIGLKP